MYHDEKVYIMHRADLEHLLASKWIEASPLCVRLCQKKATWAAACAGLARRAGARTGENGPQQSSVADTVLLKAVH